MSESTAEQAQIQHVPFAPDVARGSYVGALANYHPTPEQEAAQKAAMARQEAIFEAREARERGDVQDRLNRETRTAALHAALMLDHKPADATDLIEAAGAIYRFLTSEA